MVFEAPIVSHVTYLMKASDVHIVIHISFTLEIISSVQVAGGKEEELSSRFNVVLRSSCRCELKEKSEKFWVALRLLNASSL